VIEASACIFKVGEEGLAPILVVHTAAAASVHTPAPRAAAAAFSAAGVSEAAVLASQVVDLVQAATHQQVPPASALAASRVMDSQQQ